MDGKSANNAAAIEVLGRIRKGEERVVANIGDTRYVFVQVSARDLGFQNADNQTKLVYYTGNKPELLTLTAGHPFSLFGVNVGSELYLAETNDPFNRKGCKSLFAIRYLLNGRAEKLTEDFYDRLDAPVLAEEKQMQNYRDLARRDIFDGKEPERAKIISFIPFAADSHAISYLCGESWEDYVNQYLEQDKEKMIACKTEQDALNDLLEHPEKVAEPWEIALGKSLNVCGTGRCVAVEFLIDGKLLQARAKKISLLGALCYNQLLYNSDFETMDHGTEFIRAAGCNPSCSDITRILYRKKVVYEREKVREGC